MGINKILRNVNHDTGYQILVSGLLEYQKLTIVFAKY